MRDGRIHAHRGLVPDIAAARGVESEVGQPARAARLWSELRTQGDEPVEIVAPRIVRSFVAAVRGRPGVNFACDEIREPGQTMGVTAAGTRLRGVRSELERSR